jgi:type IX secretion system PorP/SprF family membrane protein
MKNRINYILISLLLIITNSLYAQQEVGLVFASDHMNIINPAFVSKGDISFVRSSLRKQWSGVAYAPETQVVSFGTGLGKNLSLGLSVVNDKTFIEQETFVGIDLSYKVQLDSLSQFHFGVKGGGVNYNVNLSGLETYNISADPNLYSLNSFNPNFGLGILYTRKDLYISLSVPRLLNIARARNQEGQAALFSDTPHFYLGSGYNFTLDNAKLFTLKPSILFRYVVGSPFSTDFNAMVDYNNMFELGVLYRTAISSTSIFAAKAMVKISDRLNIGYGYEIGTAQLANAGNSNELFFQFKF